MLDMCFLYGRYVYLAFAELMRCVALSFSGNGIISVYGDAGERSVTGFLRIDVVRCGHSAIITVLSFCRRALFLSSYLWFRLHDFSVRICRLWIYFVWLSGSGVRALGFCVIPSR